VNLVKLPKQNRLATTYIFGDDCNGARHSLVGLLFFTQTVQTLIEVVDLRRLVYKKNTTEYEQ
jgi:hypothetical protein